MRRPVSDAAVAVARVIMAARDAIGARYMDAIKGKSATEIKRIVVAKLDSADGTARVAKIDAANPRLREAMLEVQFGECVELLEQRADWGSKLLDQISAMRSDDTRQDGADIDGPIGRQPAPAQTH